MAAPRISAVRILKNFGVRVTTESTRAGRVHRFVRPNGNLTTQEAAVLLKTYKQMIVRMHKAGLLNGSRNGDGKLMVPVAECRRLLTMPPGARIGVRP